MSFLVDPIGFLADVVAISNFLQCHTSVEDHLCQQYCQTQDHELQLKQCVEESNRNIKKLAMTQEEYDTNVQQETDLPPENLALLVKLLSLIRIRTAEAQNKVVYGVFVKYKHFSTEAVLGFGGDASQTMGDVVKRIEKFYRSTQAVSAPKSSYIAMQIRGRYDVALEMFCCAAVLNILTMVCSLSTDVMLASADECSIEALEEEKMTVIFKSATSKYKRYDWDEKCRVFLLGKTRSGKSTLGNALAEKSIFNVSKGITGTVRVERCDHFHIAGNKRWVTEICDTPGLYDKDDLDILYKADIEDNVRALQKASLYVMTIDVDGGLDSAAWKTLKTYKSLFGEPMISMLVLVLTINYPANTQKLLETIEINWPSITGENRDIAKSNIYAVSLKDLRSLEESCSHEVVRSLATLCREKPMKPMAAFIDHINGIRNIVNSRAGNVSEYYGELLNTGWKGYEELSEQFACSRYVSLKDTKSGPLFNGFVMKGTRSSADVGALSRIFSRKTIIQVKPSSQDARNLWWEFVEKHKDERNSETLMWEFGEILYKNGFGVVVHQSRRIPFFGLRLDSYDVVLIQPHNSAQQEMSNVLYSLVNECPEELSKEVINDIANEALPIALRFQNKIVKNRFYPVRR